MSDVFGVLQKERVNGRHTHTHTTYHVITGVFWLTAGPPTMTVIYNNLIKTSE